MKNKISLNRDNVPLHHFFFTEISMLSNDDVSKIYVGKNSSIRSNQYLVRNSTKYNSLAILKYAKKIF